MYRIDNATAVAVMPAPKALGAPGYFTNGDALAAVPATIVDADWMNTVQEELATVVAAAGDELDKADHAQLLRAIRSLARATPYVPGQVIAFAGKKPPKGTLLCDGATVSRTEYADLFAAIGTIYGAGDGATTFNLPKLKDDTAVIHTSDSTKVGLFTSGQTITHTHYATAAAIGDHTHYIGVYGAGGHAHSATATAVGDHSHYIAVAGAGWHGHGASASAEGSHAHGAWTDAQGWHGHTGSTTVNGNHNHGYGNFFARYASGGASGFHEGNANYAWTGNAGDHNHGLYIDGNGTHSHNVGMNWEGYHSHTISIAGDGHHAHDLDNRGAGAHNHTISVAAVGEHTHALDNFGAGAHTHTISVTNTGGTDNLPAGLRMLYCIAY